MDSGAKDKLEGGLHELKGKVKETAGKAIDDTDLEGEGKAENLQGKIQTKVGQVKQVFEK